ncbi:MAG: hypothetical protein MUP14_07785 [Dehalococcoidia bacterium]|nr:hypothetical protein [Dehalococcoidia bacterium]
MSNEQLVAILQEARQMRAEDKERALVECPICGGPLDYRPRDGTYNCRMGYFATRKATQEQ